MRQDRTRHSSTPVSKMTATPVHRALALAVGSLLAALSINPSIASAGNWTPNNAKVLGLSTAFDVEARNENNTPFRSRCVSVTLNGALGFESPTWTIKPALNCVKYRSSGSWTAMDENMSQAAMIIPAAVQVELGITATCNLVFENLTITKANNYTVGTNGGTRPSEWILNDNANYATQNPAKCFKPNMENGTAKITAVFMMTNRSTNAAIAVK